MKPRSRKSKPLDVSPTGALPNGPGTDDAGHPARARRRLPWRGCAPRPSANPRPHAPEPPPEDLDAVALPPEPAGRCADPAVVSLKDLTLPPDFVPPRKAARPRKQPICVGRPSMDDFAYVRADDGFEINVLYRKIQLGTYPQHYLLGTSLQHEAGRLGFRQAKLVLVAQRQMDGSLYYKLWPIPLTDNIYHTSALECAVLLRGCWGRLVTSDDRYTVVLPEAVLPEPPWLPQDMTQCIAEAFRGCIVTTMEHALVRHTLGRTGGGGA